MKIRALVNHAVGMGIDEDQVDAADEKSDLIALVMAKLDSEAEEAATAEAAAEEARGQAEAATKIAAAHRGNVLRARFLAGYQSRETGTRRAGKGGR